MRLIVVSIMVTLLSGCGSIISACVAARWRVKNSPKWWKKSWNR